MTRTRRPKADLILTVEDGQVVGRLTTRQKSALVVARPGRIWLMSSSGCTNHQVARHRETGQTTVGEGCRRFVASGPAGPLDRSRPSANGTSTDQGENRFVIKTPAEEGPRCQLLVDSVDGRPNRATELKKFLVDERSPPPTTSTPSAIGAPPTRRTNTRRGGCATPLPAASGRRRGRG